MQTVKISQNRTVSPNRIIVGNKYENEVEKIKFQPPAYDGNRYLIINKYTESYAVPLPEDIFYVDSLITWTS